MAAQMYRTHMFEEGFILDAPAAKVFNYIIEKKNSTTGNRTLAREMSRDVSGEGLTKGSLVGLTKGSLEWW